MIGPFVVLWLFFTAIEVLLVGKFDAQETPVGALAGAAAAYGTLAVLRAGGRRYRAPWNWLRIAPAIGANVVRDTLRVFAILLRQIAGGRPPRDRILHVPFDFGGDDPESAARRALAVAAVSAAPNSIVLDLHPVRGTMRVHYLDPDVPPPRSKEWPL